MGFANSFYRYIPTYICDEGKMSMTDVIGVPEGHLKAGITRGDYREEFAGAAEKRMQVENQHFKEQLKEFIADAYFEELNRIVSEEAHKFLAKEVMITPVYQEKIMVFIGTEVKEMFRSR